MRDAEKLGVRNWRIKAKDRDGWRRLLELAKTAWVVVPGSEWVGERYFLQAPIQVIVPLIHNPFSSSREECKANMCFLQVPHSLNTSDDEWRHRGCISAIINCRLFCSIPM